MDRGTEIFFAAEHAIVGLLFCRVGRAFGLRQVEQFEVGRGALYVAHEVAFQLNGIAAHKELTVAGKCQLQAAPAALEIEVILFQSFLTQREVVDIAGGSERVPVALCRHLVAIDFDVARLPREVEFEGVAFQEVVDGRGVEVSQRLREAPITDVGDVAEGVFLHRKAASAVDERHGVFSANGYGRKTCAVEAALHRHGAQAFCGKGHAAEACRCKTVGGRVLRRALCPCLRRKQEQGAKGAKQRFNAEQILGYHLFGGVVPT